ncbi:outer membrane putative beta-barrel porin/alpha-amylase [Flavobacterium sp. 90]|nr:outer membrane putative beta-barrel porin/alpha-amylase [Flavobacterium sp. 81]TCK55440.1 outer membrane putative beta-barrel porin/alpha-amylase [Flavobacterium sp. 90]
MPQKHYLMAVILLVTVSGYSQDLEPRVYANVAKNLNVIAVGYVFMDGNVLTDPSLPIKDFTIQSHNVAANYIRTFGLYNKLARVQVSLPYSFMDGSLTGTNGNVLTGSRTGFADMKVRFGINLLGSPALDKSEFRSFEQKTILGVSLVTSIPTGKYYDDKQVNIGTNRWGFKPEIGVSKRFAHVYAEAYGGIWFYTNNNDYLNGKKLEQKATYSLQAHASYYFKNNMWIGFNTNWFFGGKTVIDGVSDDSQIDNWRVGGTFSTPVAKGQSVKFQYHVGAYTNNGLNYYALSVAYQYSFF